MIPGDIPPEWCRRFSRLPFQMRWLSLDLPPHAAPKLLIPHPTYYSIVALWSHRGHTSHAPRLNNLGRSISYRPLILHIPRRGPVDSPISTHTPSRISELPWSQSHLLATSPGEAAPSLSLYRKHTPPLSSCLPSRFCHPNPYVPCWHPSLVHLFVFVAWMEMKARSHLE